MAFRDYVDSLKFDPAPLETALRRAGAPARRYLILFTPRSGSSWISSVLRASGHFGLPREYINPSFVKAHARQVQTTDPRLFLAGLGLKFATDNRVFGLKATSVHIENFGADDFFQAFDPGTTIFNLWRENLVAQGISLYRAVETQRFHSNKAAVEPPAYEAEGIRKWVAQVKRVENQNCRLLAQFGRASVPIRYEGCHAAGRAALIDLFAKTLRIAAPAESAASSAEAELEKIGDGWNLEAERRFRAENADVVRQIEAGRLIKGPPARRPDHIWRHRFARMERGTEATDLRSVEFDAYQICPPDSGRRALARVGRVVDGVADRGHQP